MGCSSEVAQPARVPQQDAFGPVRSKDAFLDPADRTTGQYVLEMRTRQTAATFPAERFEIAAANEPSPATPVRPLRLYVELEHDELRRENKNWCRCRLHE